MQAMKMQRGERRTKGRSLATKPGAATLCLVCGGLTAACEQITLLCVDNILHVVWPSRRAGTAQEQGICMQLSCMGALTEERLREAFQCEGLQWDAGAFFSSLKCLAEQRLWQNLHLSRKMGGLVAGVDAVAKALSADAGSHGLALMACDLAERSRNKLLGTRAFGSTCELGRVLGKATVGAVYLPGGSVANEARYWSTIFQQCSMMDGMRT